MNDKLFEQYLRQLAEQAIPEDVDLWPTTRSQLDSLRKEEITMKTLNRKHRFRLLVLTTSVALLLTLGVTITPWGQAFAQSLFKFFAVAPSDTFPIPADELRYHEGTPVEAPATFTPVPDCDYRCQVSQAEAEAGFAIKVPPSDIRGLVFSRAYALQSRQMVILNYTAISGGSQLTIRQGPGWDTAKWDEVPPSAVVEKVHVGDFGGEYVQGMFVVKADTTSAVWEPDAPVRRLRWSEGAVTFEVRLDGHVEVVEWLDKDTLIELAQSLVYIPNILNSNP